MGQHISNRVQSKNFFNLLFLVYYVLTPVSDFKGLPSKAYFIYYITVSFFGSSEMDSTNNLEVA